MIYKCVLFIIRYYDLYTPYKQLGFVDWANERHVPSSTIHLEWLPSEAVQNATFAAARVSFRSLLTPAGLLNVFSLIGSSIPLGLSRINQEHGNIFAYEEPGRR